MKIFNKILFIGCHFDDIELGCAGTILRLEDKEVSFLILTNSEIINKKKIIRSKIQAKKYFLSSINKMKIKKYKLLNLETNNLVANNELVSKIRNYIDEFKPDTVFTHWIGDSHHDHRAAAIASLSAARHVKNIFMYKSNLYRGVGKFEKNFYINITNQFKEKIKIIKCYKDEMKRTNNKFIKQVKKINSYDGEKINCKFAESFYSLRLTVL